MLFRKALHMRMNIVTLFRAKLYNASSSQLALSILVSQHRRLFRLWVGLPFFLQLKSLRRYEGSMGGGPVGSLRKTVLFPKPFDIDQISKSYPRLPTCNVLLASGMRQKNAAMVFKVCTTTFCSHFKVQFGSHSKFRYCVAPSTPSLVFVKKLLRFVLKQFQQIKGSIVPKTSLHYSPKWKVSLDLPASLDIRKVLILRFGTVCL